MTVSTIGIDLAKNVYQAAGLNRAGKVQFNRRLSRSALTKFMAKQTAALVAMEATASAHYWGRVLQNMGHEVRLLPPQHVKAFCRNHKSDGHDAVAIAEAASRPNIHPVPIKSVAQQDLQLLNRQRRRLVRRRTQAINQMRGFAREYGVFFPRTKAVIMDRVPDALEDGENTLSDIARRVLLDLYVEVREIDEKVASLESYIKAVIEPQWDYQALLEIPAFGPVLSAGFVAAGIGRGQFHNGRRCAAWLGVVPRQHGSGDRHQLLGITKSGDRELRSLLIHGARSVCSWAVRKERDDPLGRWVRQLVERRGMNRAAVALANKLARIAWAVLTHGERFNMNKAFAG